MGDGYVVGIDVGGSAIKGFEVDPEAGVTIGDVVRVDAPPGFTVDAVLDAIVTVANELGSELPVGVGFPAVVREGVLGTDATSYQYAGWSGLGIERELERRLGRPVAVGNDADVAGEAEMRHGTASGQDGTVLVLTFGTGIGSAVSSYCTDPLEGYSKGLASGIIAQVRTDMDAFSDAEIDVLINHGYLLANIAIQVHAPFLVSQAVGRAEPPFPEWMKEPKVRHELKGSRERRWLGRF